MRIPISVCHFFSLIGSTQATVFRLYSGPIEVPFCHSIGSDGHRDAEWNERTCNSVPNRELLSDTRPTQFGTTQHWSSQNGNDSFLHTYLCLFQRVPIDDRLSFLTPLPIERLSSILLSKSRKAICIATPWHGKSTRVQMTRDK
jgi:hypothetical protein